MARSDEEVLASMIQISTHASQSFAAMLTTLHTLACQAEYQPCKALIEEFNFHLYKIVAHSCLMLLKQMHERLLSEAQTSSAMAQPAFEFVTEHGACDDRKETQDGFANW